MRSQHVLLGLATAGLTAVSASPRTRRDRTDLVQGPTAGLKLPGSNASVVSIAPKARSLSIGSVRKSSLDTRIEGLTEPNLPQVHTLNTDTENTLEARGSKKPGSRTSGSSPATGASKKSKKWSTKKKAGVGAAAGVGGAVLIGAAAYGGYKCVQRRRGGPRMVG